MNDPAAELLKRLYQIRDLKSQWVILGKKTHAPLMET